MKRDLMTLGLNFPDELIIDNFAGGGGTSTGLEAAFGRPVDIAINHDPEALAMHAINHPHTKHLCESVWDIDPIEVTGNQPVALVWLSPDCKHFSKAKGGKPVEKKIRGLAWVTMRWAIHHPRAIMLENVEEFRTWGPLIVDEHGNARPDPDCKGQTFEAFVAALSTGIPADHPSLPEIVETLGEEFPIERLIAGLGYKVEYRELRASDHATPTIRKRFFLVARRDGLPIQWPVATHGAPDSPGVRAGKLLPHRTAAECIDWSLPCPSIFDRKKPLAEATLRRIAKGIMRYVVDAAEPFIVTNTTGHPGALADAPLRTVTTGGHHALVAPSIVPVTHQGSDRSESVHEPFRTITGAQRGEKALASAYLKPYYSDKRPADARGQQPAEPINTITTENRHALVTAFLNEHANASNQRVMPADEPLRTICAQVKGGHFSMVSASLVGVGGRAGDSRPRGADEPTATITAKGDTAIATAFLEKSYGGNESPGWPLDKPISTVTTVDHHRLTSVHLTKFRTGSTGSELTDPMPTITAGPKENPAGAPHALGVVSSHLVKLRGTSTAAGMGEPLHTISAGGQHHAEVRAFLLKYYGTDQDPRLEEPLHTVTTKDRYGLVTIKGVDYEIVDIGLRMLAPHELYRAQGFPEHYIINEIPDPKLLFVGGEQVESNPLSLPRIPLTKSAQVRMCGNSVCPPLSEALIRANFAHERLIVGRAA